MCLGKLQLPPVQRTFASARPAASPQLREILIPAGPPRCSLPALLHAEESLPYRYSWSPVFLEPCSAASARLPLALGWHKHCSQPELRLGKGTESPWNNQHKTLCVPRVTEAAKQEVPRAGCTLMRVYDHAVTTAPSYTKRALQVFFPQCS